MLLAFVVLGRPVSLQARRRDRVRNWITAVRAASLQATPAGMQMSTEHVAVQITYYLDRVDIDIDNIAKPVLDALKAGVIGDDRQVHELLVRKRKASVARHSADSPDDVSEALASAPELVHVVLKTLLSEGEPE